MNPEVLIICQIVQTRDLASARKEGLEARHFGAPREKSAYEYLIHYAETHDGDVPTRDIFHTRSGYRDWVEVPDNIGVRSLAEEVIRLSLARAVEQLLPDPLELRKNPKEVGRQLLETLRTVMIDHGDRSVVSMRSAIQPLLRQIESGGPLRKGLPFPWHSLTNASLGLIAEEVSIVYGRPGTYKTWVLLCIVAYLMRKRPDCTTLFCSCELPVEAIPRRLATLLAGVPYAQVLKGDLIGEDRLRFSGAAQGLEAGGSYADVHFSPPDNLQPGEIERKVELLRPDLLILDSAYLEMEPNLNPEDHKSLSKTIRFLRRLSRDYKIPVVASFHAGRKKGEQGSRGGGDDLFGSDVISQRADVLYRTYISPGEDGGEDRLLIHVAKGREFSLPGLLIEIPPARGSYKEILALQSTAALEAILMKIAKGASTQKLARQSGPTNAALAAYAKGAERPEEKNDEHEYD